MITKVRYLSTISSRGRDVNLLLVVSMLVNKIRDSLYFPQDTKEANPDEGVNKL